MKKLFLRILLGCVFVFSIFYWDKILIEWNFFKLTKVSILGSSISGSNDVANEVINRLLKSNDPVTLQKGLVASQNNPNPQFIPFLISCVQQNDSQVRKEAFKSLSMLTSANMVTPLLNVAKRSNSATRLVILQMLSKLVDVEHLDEKLSFFMSDPNWVVRMVYADVIKNFNSELSSNTLLKLIGDPEIEVAFNAAEALSSLGQDNAYAQIFSRLKNSDNWLDQYKAIRLITLFPEKLASLLIAQFIGSPIDFLSIAALDWMTEKGGEKDFSLIVAKLSRVPEGLKKARALETLAILAPKIGKSDTITLNLIKFLSIDNEMIRSSCIQGLKFLKASIAEDELKELLKDNNIDIQALALECLGSFKGKGLLELFKKKVYSPHSVIRKSAYRSLLNFENISIDQMLNNIITPVTVEETELLGMFLMKHTSKENGIHILKKHYDFSRRIEVKIKILEMIGVLTGKSTIRKMLKLLKSKVDLKHWQRAGKIMDSSSFELSSYSKLDGFLYYRSRQDRKSFYKLLPFSSAKSSIWDNQDTVYLKNEDGGEKGVLKGNILTQNFNSYFFAHSKDEIIQIEKNLVSSVVLSPLNELFKLKYQLADLQQIFDNSLDSQSFILAGYILQKALVRLEILKKEILHHPVSKKALLEISNKWKECSYKFESLIKVKKLVNIDGIWIPRQLGGDLHILEEFPKEADKRKKEAQAIYEKGREKENQSQWSEAIDLYKKALSVWSLHSESLRQVGIAYANLGEYEKALIYYKEKQKFLRSDVNLLNSMALLYRLKGSLVKALEYYELEINENPSLKRGYLDMADVLKEQNRNDEAIDLLETAVNKINDKEDFYFSIARLQMKMEDPDSAKDAMVKLIQINPENIKALTYLGYIHFVRTDYNESIKVLKKALAYDLSDTNARLTLADVYISAGKKQNAQIELRKVLAIDPTNSDAQSMLDDIKGR